MVSTNSPWMSWRTLAPVQSPTALYVTHHGKPQSPHGQQSGITLHVSSTPRHCRRGLVHSFQDFFQFFFFHFFPVFFSFFSDFSGLISGFQALFSDFRPYFQISGLIFIFSNFSEFFSVFFSDFSGLVFCFRPYVRISGLIFDFPALLVYRHHARCSVSKTALHNPTISLI